MINMTPPIPMDELGELTSMYAKLAKRFPHRYPDSLEGFAEWIVELGYADDDDNPDAARLKKVEKEYGRRPRIPMAHGEPLMNTHFVGSTSDGKFITFCPVGFIISWHPEDAGNRYCPWCKKFFVELKK